MEKKSAPLGSIQPQGDQAGTLEVTDAVLARYAALVYQASGIRLSSQKKALLGNRLRRRLRQTGIADFDAYYEHLKRLPPTDSEWDQFLQEITTHETYLFRDDAHWEWFRREYLPEIALAEKRGERRPTLRIWSAACSTGDEAFTIASCVAGELPQAATWKVEILGTDIGIGAVEQAREARFCPRAMRLVPEEYARKFFEPLPDGWTQAKPTLRKMTEFRRHNLLESLSGPDFDLIVLKNVLIYFDQDSKRKVLDQLLRKLTPGGYLLSGAAEGISELVSGCTRLQAWLFRKEN